MKRRAFISTLTGSAILLVPVVAHTGRMLEAITPKTPKTGIAADFTVEYDQNIRYIGASDHEGYTVREFHEWLQEQHDDILVHDSKYTSDDVVELNPKYNIDDSTAEHLRGGSISQTGIDGNEEIYMGLVTIGSMDAVDVEVHQ